MTNIPDPSHHLARALKQLATVTKVISFYPSQHPAVVSSLEKAAVFLKEALTDHETLSISVAEAAFLVDGAVLMEEDLVLAGFASYLSRRDISAVNFQSPVEQESLKGFLEVIALDPGTLRARGGPAKSLSERRLGGVSVSEFDTAAAMRMARTSAALRRIGEEVASAEPESLPDLAKNLAWALMALDPRGRIDVLGSSVPIPGADLDLAGAIRASIPEEKLGELIVSMVQSEGSL